MCEHKMLFNLVLRSTKFLFLHTFHISFNPRIFRDFLHCFATDKIKKRYGNLGQVLCHTIDRGHSTNIGISLAGHRDRNKMACFIAGINPKGVASSGGLEIGDEILEVNIK